MYFTTIVDSLPFLCTYHMPFLSYVFSSLASIYYTQKKYS